MLYLPEKPSYLPPIGDFMWILYALGAAFFAGMSSILAKSGIQTTDSTLATAIRTIFVLIFSWIVVFVAGSMKGLASLQAESLLFLILSGLSTGASWLCYFKALQLGPLNKVVPIDKAGTVLTMIFAFLFLREPVTRYNIPALILIAVGTFLMVENKKGGDRKETNKTWLLYALGSAVFGSLTSILGKVGIEGIDSNLGTAIRTCVVLLMAWIMVWIAGKQKEAKHIKPKELFFIVLSGMATGGSWLFFYKALQEGEASVVVPIDKLSILVTILFSYIVFREKLTKRSALGLLLLTSGTLVLMLPTILG